MKNLLIAIVFLASFAFAQTATPTNTEKPAEHSCCCKGEAKKCDKDCCKDGSCKDGSCKDCCKSKGKGKKGCKNC